MNENFIIKNLLVFANNIITKKKKNLIELGEEIDLDERKCQEYVIYTDKEKKKPSEQTNKNSTNTSSSSNSN
jgi:hypothetical protein